MFEGTPSDAGYQETGEYFLVKNQLCRLGNSYTFGCLSKFVGE